MNNCKIIGKLDKEKLDFLKNKKPEFAEKIKNENIIMWDERIEHIEKHRMNFANIYDFDEYIKLIPEIIKNPDYIGVKDKDSSIQFIKKYSDNILIAVRLNTKGKLSFRTMFPITDSQINNYVSKNTAWKFK